jgi:phage head maturation protease
MEDYEQYRTAIHESAHAVVGEFLGLQVVDISTWRDRGAAGAVTTVPHVGESRDFLVMALAPRALMKARDMDTAGCSDDLEQAWKVARHMEGRTPEDAQALVNEAERRADEMVTRRDVEYCIERLADELHPKPRRLTGEQVGAVIAQAKAEIQTRNYLAPPPVPGTLNGATPSEELAKRAATLARLGVTAAKGTKSPGPKRAATKQSTPPKGSSLFRAVYALPGTSDGAEPMRAISTPGDANGRILQLQWSVFNRWTEIESWYEGNFMERIAPGAAKKTIREDRQSMRILLQHGRDPSIGEKPIAAVDLVEENDIGGYAEGRLFDGLDPLVVDGLRGGQYGASFRFRVMREELVKKPGVSDYNPKGLPERTIIEMAVSEFGPVTWGAYGDATAGVRSITDEIHFGRDTPTGRKRRDERAPRTSARTFEKGKREPSWLLGGDLCR